jgi:hypothetical protein
MADTKYTYSISGDFPNQKVAPEKLSQEIDDSAIASASLSYIGTDDDVCDIWFDDPLSGGDETILDGLVAVHDGVDIDVPCCMPCMSSDPENPVEGNFWWNSVGKVFKGYDGSNKRTIQDVFGSEYQSGESEGSSTTTSTSLVDKLTLSPTGLPAGNYIVNYSAEVGIDNALGRVIGAVKVDVTVKAGIDFSPNVAAADEESSFGGHCIVALDGNHDIKIQYASSNGSYTARICRARLVIWRVS